MYWNSLYSLCLWFVVRNCNWFSFNKIDLKLEKIMFLSFILIAFTLFFFLLLCCDFFLLLLHFLWNSCLIISCGVFIQYQNSHYIGNSRSKHENIVSWKYHFPLLSIWCCFFFLSHIFSVRVSPFLISLSLLILSKQYPFFHNFKPPSPPPLLYSPLVCPSHFAKSVYMFIFCQI